MSFTPNDIIARAKSRLRLTGTDKYDSDLLDWINDFHTILRAELTLINHGWEETTAYKNLVEDQYEYAIPGNIVVITALRFKQGDIYYNIREDPRLKYADYNPTTPESNVIYGFYFSGSNIYLRGAPGENVTNGLEFIGLADTTDSVATTAIAWHNHVRLIYTLYTCKTYREGEEDKETNKFDIEYDRQLDLFLKTMAHRYRGPSEIGYEDHGFQT